MLSDCVAQSEWKFLSILRRHTIGVTENSEGVDHQVWILRTKKSKYVLKRIKNLEYVYDQVNLPQLKSQMIFHTRVGASISRDRGVPAARILRSRGDMIVETYVEGESIAKASSGNRNYLLETAGEYLKRLHTASFRGYGRFLGTCSALSHKLEDILAERLNENLGRMGRANTISIKTLRTAKEYFLRNVGNFVSPSVFTHQDYRPGNMKALGKQLTGVLDFADSLAGAAMDDFAYMYIQDRLHPGQNSDYTSLLKGYGYGTDDAAIRFFAWLKLTGRIPRWLHNKSETINMVGLYEDICGQKFEFSGAA